VLPEEAIRRWQRRPFALASPAFPAFRKNDLNVAEKGNEGAPGVKADWPKEGFTTAEGPSFE